MRVRNQKSKTKVDALDAYFKKRTITFNYDDAFNYLSLDDKIIYKTQKDKDFCNVLDTVQGISNRILKECGL